MERYRHSGAVPIGGLVSTMLAGMAVACVLGFLYAYVCAFIPIVYVSFLATVGLGWAIGWSVGQSAMVGKIRNPLVVGLLGLTFGLIGLYVAWAADFHARAKLPDVAMAFQPSLLVRYMAIFYENGFWGLGRNGQDMVKGIPLAIVWVIEAGAIVGLAAVIAYKKTATLTFCERCRMWNPIEKGVRRLSAFSDVATAVDRLKAGDLAVLDELPPAGSDASTYLRVDLAQCPACFQDGYLTVTRITESIDEKGKVSTKEDALLTNLLVSQAVLEWLRQIPEEVTQESPSTSESPQPTESPPTS